MPSAVSARNNGECTSPAARLLVVLPGPAIPFQGCRYYQRVEVDLEEGAGLLWGDVWLAGRYARGRESERFRFALLRQDFLVRREGRLVFRDHFDWRGPWDEAAAAWHFGGANACGSLFATGPATDSIPLAEARLGRGVLPNRRARFLLPLARAVRDRRRCGRPHRFAARTDAGGRRVRRLAVRPRLGALSLVFLRRSTERQDAPIPLITVISISKCQFRSNTWGS